MIRFIKKVFFPGKHNDNLPHLMRLQGLALFAFIALSLFTVSMGKHLQLDHFNLTANVESGVLISLANEDRAEEGLTELTYNPLLAEAAQEKANDMAEKSYFAHTSPSGVTPWFWFQKVGYDFSYAGENLAVNFTESESVDNAWMNSPTHRANILNQNFTEIGIATAEGTYKGKTATYVVQLFGAPRKVAPTPTPLPTSTPSPELAVETTENNEVLGASLEETTPVETTKEPTTIVESQPIAHDDQTYIEAENVTPRVTDSSSDTHPVESEPAAKDPASPFVTIYVILMAILVVVSLSALLYEVRAEHRQHFLSVIALLIFLALLIYLTRNIIFPLPNVL